MKQGELPLVSVLIITFNHEKFIRQALDSVFAQFTSFGVEVIVGEDCSTDKTRNIVKEFESTYKDRLIPIYHARNVGMIENACICLERCRGKYIAMLEGDDYWISRNKLESQVKLLELNFNCSIAFHEVLHKRNGVCSSPFLGRYRNFTSEDLILGRHCIQTCSMLFRNLLQNEKFASYVRRLRTSNILNMDTFILSILGIFGSAVYTEGICAVYQIHDGGIWSGKGNVHKGLYNLRTYNELRQLHGREYRKEFSKLISARYGSLIIVCYKTKSWLLFSKLLILGSVASIRSCTMIHFLRSILRPVWRGLVGLGSKKLTENGL